MHLRHFAALAGLSAMLTTVPESGQARRALNLTPVPTDTARSMSMHLVQPRGERVSMTTSSVPVAVDGAVQPDAIPDQVALRHLLVAAAVSDDADRPSIVRRESILSGLNLAAADRVALLRTLKDLAAQLDSIKTQPDALTAKSTRDSSLNAAQTNVGTALSAEGLTKLEAYLREHVKPRIKIYGAVPGV
jgi:hypothetical protein